MSYIERAVYDYIIKILSEGIQVLLSRRFILFTLLLVLSGALSIFVTLGLVTFDRSIVELVFLIQAATSISFIAAGLVAKRLLSTLARFLVLLGGIVIIGSIGVGSSSQFLNIAPVNQFLLEYYPIVCLLLWTLFMPLAGFGFAKGMFYNKVTGSILFLGKPQDDHKAIFYIFLSFLALIGIILGAGIFFIKKEYYLIQIAGIFSFIASLIVFLIVFGYLIKNEALNSAISVFFLASAFPSMIMLLISDNSGIIGTFNYLILGFSLIYTAQGQAKRASKFASLSDEEMRVEMAKEKLKDDNKGDPFGISWILRQLGAEGIVLVFLGTFLGYNLLQLEFFYDKGNNLIDFSQVFVNIFGTLTVGQIYQIVSLIIVTIFIVLIILSYYIFPPARKFFKPDLIRLNFLPNYDEIKGYLTAVQSGEISKKEVTADAIKLVGGQFAKASVSAGKGLLGLGLSKLGRNKKEEDNNE